jgi:hypothetical protein
MNKTAKAAIDWLIRGKDGKIHLVQFPNTPIIGWAVFLITSFFVPEHPLKVGLGHISTGFLAIWAYLEATQGLSRIRKVLGIAIGIALIYSCF